MQPPQVAGERGGLWYSGVTDSFGLSAGRPTAMSWPTPRASRVASSTVARSADPALAHQAITAVTATTSATSR